MDLGLHGKTSVVTGASRGIGLEVAHALLREGASVIAAARTAGPQLEALAATGPLRAIEVDLATPDGPQRLIEAAGATIDILVNNVGSAPARTGGFLSVTDDEWHATLELNLLAAVRTTRAAVPTMLRAAQGSIVNVCSVNSKLSDPAVIDYRRGQGRLGELLEGPLQGAWATRHQSQYHQPRTRRHRPVARVRGVVDTVARATGASTDTVIDEAAHSSVTGRFSRPTEVADLVLLLASQRTANVTGADITIDGGLVPTW